ncbi:uncharacterized protein LOC110725438 [Chenopodium quinoa]|uniref:uncharacterized protein LOC110725438 n=1 Tax=Chenopodium quinoa TaxID=63459 RepID=UPI000B794778|nr:uncharacterized protein LOC110725438 [Chenopodium quinoa]
MPDPEIQIEDETHTLGGNEFHMPLTPERQARTDIDPMAGFTSEELATAARVMTAMSRKRKEIGATQDGGGMPFTAHGNQFDQAGSSQRRRNDGSPTRSRQTPRESEVRSSAQDESTGTYQQGAKRRVVQLRASPFAQSILDQPMEKIKMPTCRYEGRGDPRRYITSYEGHMILYTNSDAVWCKVFPTTLVGAAADWFNNLENGAVHSFQQLAEMFVGQYVSNSVRQRTSGELMAVTQKADESLRDYIRRFNNEANTIPRLQHEIAVMALMNGLNDSEFKRYLTRKNQPTLAAAFNKAHNYIKSEELMKTSSRISSTDRIHPMSEGGSSGVVRSRNPTAARGGSRQEVRGTKAPMRYNSYTPLNAPRAAIYSINQNREGWVRPVPMKAKGRDTKKGHLTQYRLQSGESQQQQYRQPERQQIEYRPERQGQVNQQGEGGQPPSSTGKRVDVITGGPVHGGTISGARKHLSEYRHIVNALDVADRPQPSEIPNVTFTKEDAKGIVFPHDDPLVLIAKINGADVKRVLVDGGSSANVLFMQAFNELMIGRQYLTPVSCPVIGFNGSTMRP